ncbi:hypothetical protein AA309_29330 [Microvirga vignae]|uniref:Uncharacterized protein n=1 Tax=Microvirga vignae TaxID=1225564 RepID=A0A0H1R3W5_9HYPH|nr:hypothetical protein AA309_29330 [Microvirga vignae]
MYVVTYRRPQQEGDAPDAAWTHVYRVSDDTRTGRPVVYVEAVLKGDCMVRGLARAQQLIEIFGDPSWSAQSPLSSFDAGEAA